MMKLQFIFIGIILFSLNGMSAGVKGEPINFTISPDDIKLESGALHFIVPQGLHFNKEAPNKAEAMVKGDWVKADKVEARGTGLTATWSQTIDPCSGVKAELFVCDDKNTFCLPRNLTFKCKKGKFISSPTIRNDPLNKPKFVPNEKQDAHFILNDADQALSLARETHKPILIDFFGIWCPPCNELDETVYNTPEFRRASDQFILLKLDSDSPASWKLKSKYNITGYPTIIFATESGDEISRLIGYRPKLEFVGAMTEAIKNKDNGIETKKLKAESNDKIAYELGNSYLEKEEYFLADYYLLRASRHWTLPDIRRNKLMSAQLGLHSKAESIEDKKVYEKLLVHALEWYPRQTEVFDRTERLIALAQELNDKEATHLAYITEISTAKWYMNHPKALKGTDIVRGDLYEILGSAYEAIDEKQKSLDAYSDGAKEYLREIKSAGLDENSERGYNLERIYCLWKSGQIEQAQKIYESFERQYPKEFTFYYQHAKLLKALKSYKGAEEKALKAFEFSYGDNRLRVAALLAEVYQSENDKKKAIEILDNAMTQSTLPEDKTIRSHRYFNKLSEMKKKIQNS